jgi:hypothetical protein
MPKGITPRATCGHSDQTNINDGTSCLGASPTPGAIGHGDSPQVVSGTIVEGDTLLSKPTLLAISKASAAVPSQWHRYIAYEKIVKVGGSLAWRANNPGNLRDLANLKVAEIDLDKDVQSQIDKMMIAVQNNKGLIKGIEIQRLP